MKIKKQLLNLRRSKGLSRYRVAHDTGISYSSLQRMEEDDSRAVKIMHLETLARYYNTDIVISGRESE